VGRGIMGIERREQTQEIFIEGDTIELESQRKYEPSLQGILPTLLVKQC
jgi:hypothetical protein